MREETITNLAKEQVCGIECGGKLKWVVCNLACAKKCCKKYKRGKKPCKSCPKH